MKVRVIGLPDKIKTLRVKIIGIPKAQSGGQLPETKGLPESQHHLANIEAEGGEVYQNQGGGYTKISNQAPSHEAGGVMIPDAKRVLEDTSIARKDKFSKMLKMSPGEVDSIFGFKPKSSLSHAKTFEKAKNHYQKQKDKINRKQKNLNDIPKLDKYGINAAKANFLNRENIPSDDDVFNTLFEHQEAIKATNNIPNDGKQKYGGWKPTKYQTGGDDMETYQGSKNPGYTTTPTGVPTAFNIPGGLESFKEAWQPYVDLNKYKNAKDAQMATYYWMAKNQPQILAQDWIQNGLTAKGRKMMDPKSPDYDPDFAKTAGRVFDNSGKLKTWIKMTPDVLQKLAPAYGDNMLGVRTIVPHTDIDVSSGPNEGFPMPTQDVTPQQIPFQPIQPRFINRPENHFNEPMQWYDLAPGMAEYMSAGRRDPELYNPIQIHQLKYKLLNPTNALEANQADFNAANKTLGEQNLGSGVRAANVANIAGQKYRANNQILGQYENQNAQIRNQEIGYNTQARDRQSMANAQSREQFYNNVLRARSMQSRQKLQAIQDISRAFQLQARQNRSGNLILQATPHFNEYGEYNGYQDMPILPYDLPNNQGFIPQNTAQQKQTTKTTFKIGNKTYQVTDQNP